MGPVRNGAAVAEGDEDNDEVWSDSQEVVDGVVIFIDVQWSAIHFAISQLLLDAGWWIWIP